MKITMITLYSQGIDMYTNSSSPVSSFFPLFTHTPSTFFFHYIVIYHTKVVERGRRIG